MFDTASQKQFDEDYETCLYIEKFYTLDQVFHEPDGIGYLEVLNELPLERFKMLVE